MAHASLPALVRYCDSLLRTDAVRDWDRAHNGLQVENDGRVTRLAAAVDASLATVRRAIAAQRDRKRPGLAKVYAELGRIEQDGPISDDFIEQRFVRHIAFDGQRPTAAPDPGPTGFSFRILAD